MNAFDVHVYLSERTDETRQTDDSSVCKQLRDLGDTSNVLFAIFRTEAEILVESVADIVSIQAVRRNSLARQVAFQFERQRCLASTRQTCNYYYYYYYYYYHEIVHRVHKNNKKIKKLKKQMS